MRPAGYQPSHGGYHGGVAYSHTIGSLNGILPQHQMAGLSRTGLTAAQRKALETQAEARRKAEELRNILSSLEKVNDEGRRSSLLDIVCPTEVISSCLWMRLIL